MTIDMYMTPTWVHLIQYVHVWRWMRHILELESKAAFMDFFPWLEIKVVWLESSAKTGRFSPVSKPRYPEAILIPWIHRWQDSSPPDFSPLDISPPETLPHLTFPHQTFPPYWLFPTKDFSSPGLFPTKDFSPPGHLPTRTPGKLPLGKSHGTEFTTLRTTVDFLSKDFGQTKSIGRRSWALTKISIGGINQIYTSLRTKDTSFIHRGKIGQYSVYNFVYCKLSITKRYCCANFFTIIIDQSSLF